MAFSENIEIINISNLNKVSDLALDDIIIINDVSESESKIVDLADYNTFVNRNLELNSLKDVAIGGGVGRELRRGQGIVWNGTYWVNEPIVEEAPLDGGAYLRQGGDWLLATESGVQSVQALAGLENIGSESVVKLQVDQNWFDVRYAQRGNSISATDITVTNSDSLSEKGRLEYDNRGNFTYYPVDSSDYLTLETLPPESDPLFMASAAAGIRFIDVQNWNTAYSWGNHADAGYVRAEDLVLNSLNDVNVANMRDGHVLKWSANSGSWYNGEGGLGKLGDMYDVNTAGTGDGWGLLYDAASEFWLSSPLLLEKLTDVKVQGVSNGDYLGWDGDNWVNVGQEDVNLDIIGGFGIEVQSLGPTSYIVELDAILHNLKDCVVAGAQQGDFLRYYNGVWLPAEGNKDPVIPTVNNPRITLKAGTNMSGGGSFTLNQGAAHTITFNAVIPDFPEPIEPEEGAFYKIKTSKGGAGNVQVKLDSTMPKDDSQIVIKPGTGINFTEIDGDSFKINAATIEIDEGAFYKFGASQNNSNGKKNVKLKLDSTLKNDDTSVVLKPGNNIEFTSIENDNFTINAIIPEPAPIVFPPDTPVAQYNIKVDEGGNGNIKVRLNSTLDDDSQITLVPGDGITFSDVIDDNKFTISAIPEEASVPNLQQVLDKGNTADRNINLQRNVGTPQETGIVVSSRGFIEITDESSGQPHIEFRNAIGGNDDYDWELRQIGAKFHLRYDDNKSNTKPTVVEVSNNDVKFGDARNSDGVRIQYRGRIELTDETSGTPEIEFRNAVGGNDRFDWRVQQVGRTFNIDHDKDDGLHNLVQIKGTNSNDAGLLTLGESKNKDGMDMLIHGEMYDDDSFAHPILGAKIWGTIVNTGSNKGAIKMGSKRRNGNYNFSASNSGDGRIRITFNPPLATNDYCVMVTAYDDEGDHMAGVMEKERDSMRIYSKDLENFGTETSGDFDGDDECRELMFAVIFQEK